MCDGDSIVGNGNACIFGAFQSELHFPFIQRASAAVNNHSVRAKICREFGTAGEYKIQGFSGVFLDPPRQLDCSDIFALAVMGAALAD